MRPWERERTPGSGSAGRDAGSAATRKPAIRKRRGRRRSRRVAIRPMYQKSIGGRKVKRREGGRGSLPRGGAAAPSFGSERDRGIRIRPPGPFRLRIFRLQRIVGAPQRLGVMGVLVLGHPLQEDRLGGRPRV